MATAYFPSTIAHTIPAFPASVAFTSMSPRISSSDSDPDTLICALANPKTLSDDELYASAATAQQAMVLWQNEYQAIDRHLRYVDQGYKSKFRARNLEEPWKYDLQHAISNRKFTHPPHATTGSEPTNITNTEGPSRQNPRNPGRKAAKTAKTKGRDPANPPPKARKNNLAIDMNVPSPSEITGKRDRKPRKPFGPSAPNPTTSTKRKRSEPAIDRSEASNPQAKLQRTEYTRPAWAAASDTATSSAPVKAEVAAPPAAKSAKAKNSKRSETMRAAWARRQAQGTNGRHGGMPKQSTVAKALAQEKGVD